MNLIRLPNNKLLQFLPSSWAPSIYAALKGAQPRPGLAFVNDFETPVLGDAEEIITAVEDPLRTHVWMCGVCGVDTNMAGYAISSVASAFQPIGTSYSLPDQLTEFAAATGLSEADLYSQGVDESALAALSEVVVGSYSSFSFRLQQRLMARQEPLDEPEPPREVTKLTLRRRLRELGKEQAFDAALDSIPHARSDWDDATSVRTDDPIFVNHIDALKSALGIDDAQLQQLFE